MSLLRLALANLFASWLTSVVNVLLLALGTASIAILLLANAQLSSALSRNAAGIDLVIGAKGSPLQLVLAGVYHVDVPPGNISSAEIERWQGHPRIASAIPLSLGDSFRGFRVIDTVPEFASLYDAQIADGRIWRRPFEVVIGSRMVAVTGLAVGDSFAGVHGLSDDGERHEESRYQIVGVFESTNTVLDGLIVTSTESVWLMHNRHAAESAPHQDGVASHDHEALQHDHEAKAHAHEAKQQERDQGQLHNSVIRHGNDITLLLIEFSSPIAALTLPREINAETNLQAASPPYEITRLLQIVGVGLNWLNAFAGSLVIGAALSIFAALYASLRARRHDLAVMRCLGATRGELFNLLFVEGLLLTIAGIGVGLAFAHGGIELLSVWWGKGQAISVSGWIWVESEYVLVVGLLLAGAVAAMLPAWQAYSADVARTLSAP